MKFNNEQHCTYCGEKPFVAKWIDVIKYPNRARIVNQLRVIVTDIYRKGREYDKESLYDYLDCLTAPMSFDEDEEEYYLLSSNKDKFTEEDFIYIEKEFNIAPDYVGVVCKKCMNDKKLIRERE